jgi:hypothetical protein
MDVGVAWMMKMWDDVSALKYSFENLVEFDSQMILCSDMSAMYPAE